MFMTPPDASRPLFSSTRGLNGASVYADIWFHFLFNALTSPYNFLDPTHRITHSAYKTRGVKNPRVFFSILKKTHVLRTIRRNSKVRERYSWVRVRSRRWMYQKNKKIKKTEKFSENSINLSKGELMMHCLDQRIRLQTSDLGDAPSPACLFGN